MASASIASSHASSAFSSLHIIEPASHHTYTAVFLHGRGSHGEEFAEELFGSYLPGQQTILEAFPGLRCVFPSSRILWDSTFEEDMPAWFEARSLSNTRERQDLQMPGLGESVAYVQGVINDEIKRLDGRSQNVCVVGISQGCAIGLWALLSGGRQLGAFVGASGWLPFAAEIQAVFGQGAECPETGVTTAKGMEFVKSVMGGTSSSSSSSGSSSGSLFESGRACMATPVLLGHGEDDAYVDIELGREVLHTLERIGLAAEWREYSGAEQEGHWFKAPEQLDDMTAFLVKAMGLVPA